MAETIALEENQGIMKMGAEADAAWSSLDALSRCHYKPLIYLGRELDGNDVAQYWFVAEQVVIFPAPVRRIVLLAIRDDNEEYSVGAEPTLVLAA